MKDAREKVVPSLDVFFLMDTTGSMGGEISTLQSSLTGTVIPGIEVAVVGTHVGARAGITSQTLYVPGSRLVGRVTLRVWS